MKCGQKRKKNATVIKKNNKNGLDLGAMSVDDFMQNGLNISDESEDNSDVDETRQRKLPNFKEYSNKNDESVIDKKNDCKNGDSQQSETDGAMESEIDSEIDEDENDETVCSDDFEVDSNAEEGNESDDKSEDDVDYVEKKVESEEDENIEKEGDWTSDHFSPKKAIEKLRKSDPEFYKYLQQNDKSLLNFDESDSEEEEKDDDESGGKVHKLPDHLEVASDESDYEDGVKSDSRTITLKMVKEWESQLRSTSIKSCETIDEVMHAFHAVVVRVSSDDDESAKYIVTGSSVFNAVIQLCVMDLQPALIKYLKVPKGKHCDPTKNKVQWIKVNKNVHSYIGNLIKLLDCVSSANILAVILKHLHQMIPFAACFIPLVRPLLKMLVTLWSTGEETVRVVSFLCLLRLTTQLQNKILDKLLKMMYLAFIRNCKFVSPSELPAINFMRRSLVEMLGLDLNITYEHAFLYIRQLAIHLRTAITVPKRESFQAVCNWQFVNSVHLWADILGATVNKPQLQPLIYPLVQVTLGIIKLIPTAYYFPLRFHCTQILIELSKKTCVFIPVLPFLLEVLNTYDFNKPHKKVSMKPMVFTFIIRASKMQMVENGFKDAVIDTIYQQMLEYLNNESNSISFPDLIIPAVIQIKKFLKTCKVSNYCRKMKQILDKITENAKMVEKERQMVNFKLSDQKSIGAWETQLKLKGTPLSKYYDSWSKIHAQQQAKMITQNDEIGEYNLPVLKKRSKEKTKSEDETKPVVLFPSDDSDSDCDFLKSGDQGEDIVRKSPTRKKQKRDNINDRKNKKSPKEQKTGLQTNRNQQIDENLDLDAGDIVEDLKWEDLK